MDCMDVRLGVKRTGLPVRMCVNEPPWPVEESSVHQQLHVRACCRRWRGSLLHGFSHRMQSVVQVGVLVDHLLNVCRWHSTPQRQFRGLYPIMRCLDVFPFLRGSERSMTLRHHPQCLGKLLSWLSFFFILKGATV